MSTLPGQALLRESPFPHGALDWQRNALCRRASRELLTVFFPRKGQRHEVAKDICTACEVAKQCLDFAIANDERYGVWGGLNPEERKRLARDLKAVS